MDKPEYFYLHEQQVKQLQKHVLIGVAGTLINSLILTFVLWKVTSHVTLTVWLTASVLVSFLRLLMHLGLRSLQEPSSFGRQEMWFNIGIGFSGFIWGSAGIFLFPADSIAHQSFVAFVLGGMVAGAAGTLSVMLRSFLIFSLPALLPMVIRFFAIGDAIHFAMGGMTLLFGILMFWTAKRVNIAITSSLQLQFENSDLIRRLEQRVKERTSELEKANDNLKEQVEKRKEAEKALLELNENLENRIRERTAELERNTRELQEFVFVASHDLSEPLRKVQTFGSLLKAKNADRLDEQSTDYVSRMTGAANRMQELLDALLRYSRVGSKGQEFRLLRLSDIALDAACDLEVTIQKIGAHLEIGSLPTLRGDPFQLRQLFQNLLGNSIKYYRSEVKPLIRVYGKENTVAYHIFVEDNGIGFDEKYLEKIFQPFQRLHGRNEYPGQGIGLAICRKIVERHGGTITAKSTPGKGSTFIITLPVEQTAPDTK